MNSIARASVNLNRRRAYLLARSFSPPQAVGQGSKARPNPAMRNNVTALALLLWVGGVYYYSIQKIKGTVSCPL